MKWKEKIPYLYAMLAGFGTIALSLLFFFVIYRYQGFNGALKQLANILGPFIYGAAFAYLLKIPCNWLDGIFARHLPAKMRRAAPGLSVAISVLGSLTIVYVLFMLLIPQLLNSILTLFSTVPGQVDKYMVQIEHLLENSPVLLNYINTSYTDISTMLSDWLKTTAVPYLQQMASGVGLGVVNFLVVLKNIGIGMIVAVYLLLSRHKYSRQARLVLYSVLKRDWADRLLDEFHYADRMFGSFISGQLLDSSLIGVICYVFVLCIGVPSPLLIAVIVGTTNCIPFFGPYIGAVPSLLLILIDSPLKALWYLIFTVVLQQIDGNIIAPRIFANATGLSSFWVLFSILLFGGLWGFVGMLVAVPLFAVIYDILRKLIFRGLHRNSCDEMLVRYNQIYGAKELEKTDAPPSADSPQI